MSQQTVLQFAGQAPAQAVDSQRAVPGVGDSDRLRQQTDDSGRQPVSEREALEGTVADLNKTAMLMKSDLEFAVDDKTDIRIVKVIDRETKELIRQIPSEEIIRFVEVFDRLRGLLVSEKA
ncbi:flagellar protein FlaG [Laribacter hongkongensis]|uniref:flagellar protein FlaG n=1 Tax=Laribacter hongkongensis TaxID=168471 RepID=UPI001EFD8615|nr:flagellar protein FlaG [Laribacter hongkongensis]MCG9053587.1 flagellar protein FlaG [Laribacter hongkongensis]